MKKAFVIISKRANKPFLTSVEDMEQLAEGQKEFQTSYSVNPKMFSTQEVAVSAELFEQIQPLAGTIEAPALVENAKAALYPNRQNVYIENGELFLVK